jgi:hypothetical protein
LHFGGGTWGGVWAEDAGDAFFFEFGDGAFEEVSEDVDVDFVFEVVVGDVGEEVGPVVLELKVIDEGIVGEEAPVVAVGDIGVGLAFVDDVEEVQEALPTGVGDAVVRGYGIPGALDGFWAEEAAVFAEGDEDDAVKEALGDVDGVVEGFFVVVAEVFDEAGALVGVVFVEFVADFLLAFAGAGEEVVGASGDAEGLVGEEAGLFEEAPEGGEVVGVAEVLEGEFFVGLSAAVFVVEAEA